MPVHIIILRVTVISRSSSGAYLLKNSFMKNRNLEHKNDWKTPQSLLSKLTEEF